MLDEPQIEIAGEDALIVYFSAQVSSDVAAKVQQAQQLIRQNMVDDIVDLIPSYASILIVFDALKTDYFHIKSMLRMTLTHLSAGDTAQGTLVELPVYYSIESGPDLKRIASQANLTVEQVIDIHQQQQYSVYAIGFAPGFAYLGQVDQRIAMPRLKTPRLKVPKGAVAIADRQTSVYPSISPGGWNVIGLCPINMFDANARPTMPMQVGDKVQFKAINKDEFLSLGGMLDYVSQ